MKVDLEAFGLRLEGEKTFRFTINRYLAHLCDVCERSAQRRTSRRRERK